MSTIRREIEVEGAPSVVGATWEHFVTAVLSGPRRLACDDYVCVDAVKTGKVSFQPAPDGNTVVTFAVPDQSDVPPQDLEHRLSRDLVVFKDYVERVAPMVGRLAPGEVKAEAEADAPFSPRPQKENPSERDETVSYTDHFPT